MPGTFEQEVSFASFGTQSLPEILDTLSRMTGMAIEAREVLASSSQAGSAAAPMAGQPTLQQQAMSYRFSGKLRHLLDDLAARLGASWRYDHDTRQVVLYRYESRIFAVMLPAGKKGVNASISIGGAGGGSGSGSGGGSAGGASGGGGSVSIQSDMSIDPWTSLLD
ncbi:MAG: hypothetical protein N2690_08535, partial [Rhodocyclaceae bacterium]|nr:hypothetical protein [Rhodocyclaceae bacterium]